ncbi:hypothetical protein [Chitinophaga sp. RAB17]
MKKRVPKKLNLSAIRIATLQQPAQLEVKGAMATLLCTKQITACNISGCC